MKTKTELQAEITDKSMKLVSFTQQLTEALNLILETKYPQVEGQKNCKYHVIVSPDLIFKNDTSYIALFCKLDKGELAAKIGIYKTVDEFDNIKDLINYVMNHTEE